MTAIFWILKKIILEQKKSVRKIWTNFLGIMKLEENWTGISLFPRNLGQVMKLLVQTSVLDFMPNACTEEGMMEAATASPSCCWRRLLTPEIQPVKRGAAAQQEPPWERHPRGHGGRSAPINTLWVCPRLIPMHARSACRSKGDKLISYKAVIHW